MMPNDLVLLESHLTPLAPRFEQALAGALPVEKLMQSVLISAERNPALLDCTRDSVLRAAMSAACLGLPIDGVTGQAFMIPFKEKGTPKAQLVIGYKGFNTLAARAHLTVTGKVVREGEPFEYELGSQGFVRHKPLGDAKARITHAWAVATHRFRPPIIEVMSIDELMAVKARSPGARRSDSPWNDPHIGFPAMCEKTAKRRLARSIPMANEPGLAQYQMAARLDEAHEEQGAYGYVTERGVEIETEAARIGRFEPSATPTASDLTSAAHPPPPVAAGTGGEAHAPPVQGLAPDHSAYESYVDDKLQEEGLTAADLKAWWHSDTQKKQREPLSEEVVLRVKRQVSERLFALEGKVDA